MDRLPMNPVPQPTWRKPAGILLILLLIALWAVIVATVADALGGLPWPLKALFFVVAGLVWILPLKPLLRWMELGRFRQE
jgi:predicted membrane channel-forming protein YqfA (hemolysin III family)